MAALPRAIALLLLSYFRVFPGMGSFMLVGLACVGGAMATGDATQRFVWMAAAASFLVAVPALFAGTHFRGLASRRSHARLPGFTSAMSCAAIGLFLLLSMGSALLMQLQSEPSSLFAMGSLAFAGWSSLFWFGFLPNIMRALLGFASIAALLRWPGSMPDLSAALEWNDAKYGWVTASACGWLIFATWFGRRMRQYRTFERVELAHWNLPMGLRWGTSERVGSPAGTLLLGIGDAPSARAARAVFGVLLVPGALLGMLSAMLPTELVRDWIGDPVPIFLMLAYALGYFTHLCQRAAERQPLLWLREGYDWPGLRRYAERVLMREWLGLAIALLALNALIAQLGGWSVGLISFSATWLLTLLINLQLALCPRISQRVFVLGFSTHLLLLTLCLGVLRVGGNSNVLWLFAGGQLVVITLLRFRRT